MQIAITIPDDQVDDLDRLVPDEFNSRSEAVRVAVAEWLAERRAKAIDEQMVAGYTAFPQSVDGIDSGAAGPDGPEPPGWENLEWED